MNKLTFHFWSLYLRFTRLSEGFTCTAPIYLLGDTKKSPLTLWAELGVDFLLPPHIKDFWSSLGE